MANTKTKELQAKEKSEVAAPAEQTTPGPAFTPAVDIFETDKDITVLADMPGVRPSELAIDVNDRVLTLSGEVTAPEGADEVELLREYRIGKYFRQFTLSEVIDQEKIEAKLSDGVLRLSLPKVEAAKPRKIQVKVG